MSRRIRVLVVDDSALMRKLIPQAYQRDPPSKWSEPRWTAIGLKKIDELASHVVTLDLEMPRMDGIEMLRQITRKHHVPVIIVSAQTEPAPPHLESSRARRIRLRHQTTGRRFRPHRSDRRRTGHENQGCGGIRRAEDDHHEPRRDRRNRGTLDDALWPSRIVAIGVSTGGPNALQYVFSQLPEDFPGCLIVVQHMPEGFTEMFARRLDESSAIEVKEARSGDLLARRPRLICPGNRHIKVRSMEHGNVAILVDQPRVNGHRPSVDVLFHSVARNSSNRSLAVLMTGMGEDGAAGMGAVRSAGGITIAQSPETCVVDSMPRAAIERGFAIVSFPFRICRCPAIDVLPEYSTARPTAADRSARFLEGDSHEAV